jgi:hypothetical protein
MTVGGVVFSATTTVPTPEGPQPGAYAQRY